MSPFNIICNIVKRVNMPELYSESCSITVDSRTRGVKSAVYDIADEYELSVTIDSDTYYAGGIIFKRYETEYNIRFRGVKEKVKQAIKALKDQCDEYNQAISMPVSAASGF